MALCPNGHGCSLSEIATTLGDHPGRLDESVGLDGKAASTEPVLFPYHGHLLVTTHTDQQFGQLCGIPEADRRALLKQAGKPAHRRSLGL